MQLGEISEGSDDKVQMKKLSFKQVSQASVTIIIIIVRSREPP